MKNLVVVAALFVICFGMTAAFAQNSENISSTDLSSVGNGIEIDLQGTIFPLSKEKSAALGKMMENVLEPLPESLDKTVPMRKISLKKLDAQVKKIVDQFDVLPDTIRYLGGLTSIEAIVADPDNNDLLLIGPAEGWMTDSAGNVIGKESGKPILLFEDFLSVLRAWNRSGYSRGITCSFEPTQEIQTKLARLHQQFTVVDAQNAQAYFTALEETYGNCPITISGISASSRFARILVAADFKMKRIALGLESSQTRNIPSYVSMLSASRLNVTPQFWLSPHFSSISHDSKKLTWRLGDLKIRVTSQSTNGLDRAAINWCRRMEENYDTLAKVQPIFGELRNNMQLTLAAALIHQENLLQKSNCNLTILLNDNVLKLIDYPSPKAVTYKSVLSKNGFSTIVACGGIEINPATALQNNVGLDHKMDSERTKLIQTTGDEWWSH